MIEFGSEQLDYFHLLHQLVKTYGSDAEITCLADKRLLIKPKPALSFPARDVDTIQEESTTISLVCQFMGLYGVDSPLPFYLNQACLGEEPSNQVMRDFLDIFNHRNYVLYFLAWRAFYPETALDSGDRSYIDFVRAMSGHLVNDHCLSLANAMGKPNAASLYTLLNYFLPDIPVCIHESCETWVRIDNLPRLGTSDTYRLGDSSLLGERMLDASRLIKIDIGPVSWQQSKQLMPGEPLAKKLWSMLRANVELMIDFDVNLLIQVEQSEIVLGQSDSSLGRQTWLGHWRGDYIEVCFSGTEQQLS